MRSQEENLLKLKSYQSQLERSDKHSSLTRVCETDPGAQVETEEVARVIGKKQVMASGGSNERMSEEGNRTVPNKLNGSTDNKRESLGKRKETVKKELYNTQGP